MTYRLDASRIAMGALNARATRIENINRCGAEHHCDILSQDGSFLYFDGGHLTLQGARELGAELRRAFPDLFSG